MTALLLRTAGVSVPASLLFAGSLIGLFREPTPWRIFQTAGAAGFLLVVLTHFCEALRWLPWMGWGLEHTPGHYLDLAGAILGITLFPVGFFVSALTSYAMSRREHLARSSSPTPN